MVDARLCILREQLDPATGRLRWGIPSKDRCACDSVVAPKFECTSSSRRKPPEMWYIDEPKPLTRTENWTPKKLDELLERTDLCCKFIKY